MASTIFSEVKSTVGSPYVFYTLQMSYSARTQTSIKVSYTITSHLQYYNSNLGGGYGITGYVYAGNNYQSVTIKSTSASWSGTGSHSVSGSFTVSGLSATTNRLNVYFQATSTPSGDSGTRSKIGAYTFYIPTYNAKSGWSINPTSVNVGGSTTLSTSKIQSSNYHKVSMSYGGKSYSFPSNYNSSGTLTMPTSLGSWFGSTVKSIKPSMTVTTYNSSGGSLGGTSASFTLNLTESVAKPDKPTLKFLGLTDTGARYEVITPATKYGATISSWNVSADKGKVIKNGNIITSTVDLDTEGAVKISVSVKDSRGFTSETESATYTPELTKFRLYIDKAWKKAIPYIYANGAWKKAVGSLYDKKWDK